MTTTRHARLDRRTLIARSAATAALATLLSRGVLPGSAQPSPEAQEDVASLVAGNTAFALDLYHQLRQGTDGNLLVSPYSISLALAMAFAGARGETADQMSKVLQFPDPDVHDAFAALTDDLLTRGNIEPDEDQGQVANGLRIANALWGEQTFPFSADFAARLEASYGAGLQETDFAGAPDVARGEINAWVEEQTEDRIQDIVPAGAIDPRTRLVLANAIYFYGSWRHPFEPDLTEDDTFHLPDGSTVDVPFMQQREHVRYTQRDGMQLVDLPYAADGFTMTIILPDHGELGTFGEDLDSDALTAAIDGMESTEIRLWLPTFEFEYSASLAATLVSLGMTDAFDARLADFTGMIEEGADPRETLAIGDVLHKAFISVDEKGTEAAAATVVLMPTGAAPGEDVEPPEIRIDRPFLFAIRDTQTGTILFLGRVTDPRR